MNGNLRGVRDLLKYLSKMHKDAMVALTSRFVFTFIQVLQLLILFLRGVLFSMKLPFMFRCCMSGQMVDETVSNPGIHRGA